MKNQLPRGAFAGISPKHLWSRARDAVSETVVDDNGRSAETHIVAQALNALAGVSIIFAPRIANVVFKSLAEQRVRGNSKWDESRQRAENIAR
jgi:hypothetical protein